MAANTFSLKNLGLPRTVSVKAVTGCNLDAVACVYLNEESEREVFGSLNDTAVFFAPEDAIADRLHEKMYNGVLSLYMGTEEALVEFEKHAEWFNFFSN
jgi:hypothetical protein